MINEQFTRANKALNDLPAVKTTKEITKKSEFYGRMVQLNQ